jgi:hypothetical protein
VIAGTENKTAASKPPAQPVLDAPILPNPKPVEPPTSIPHLQTPSNHQIPVSQPPPRPTTPPLTQNVIVNSSPQSKDDFIMVNAGDDEPEYSPGGRPKVKRPAQIVTALSEIQNPPQPQRPFISPGADAPMVLEDYVMKGPPSPGANAPIIVEPPSATDIPQVFPPGPAAFQKPSPIKRHGSSQASTPPVKFEPPRPAYTPFKYNSDVETPKMPADKAYSSLRHDALDSGRFLVHKPSVPSLDMTIDRASTPVRRVQDEAFIGLIRQQSKAIRSKTPGPPSTGPIPQLRPGTPSKTPIPFQQPPPLPRGDDLTTTTSSLRALLPQSMPDCYGLSQHVKANSVKAALDGIPDSFGFIRDTMISWDRENQKVRRKQDDERGARQAESERHIDDLFNDNEIGYADIGELEADFKLAEAERKYQEDQQELESFTQRVYVPVTERIQKEIADLNAQYTIAVDLLDLESESASRMLNSKASKAEMGFVMSCLLSLANKLEIRYQKIAEANIEREQRRKRLEVNVLYASGNTAAVKSLEAEFLVAEKMQVLHEARGKDTRANKLMDTFDRATVRGLGDNQTYIDDMVFKIRDIKEIILKNTESVPESFYGTDGPRDTLALAQKAIDFVLADSQKLLTISNVADKLLNDADFAVSVAEAKVSSADAVTYNKLAGEKEKEDQKIVDDTNVRMASIAKGPEEASGLIREVIDRVGNDPLHTDRMKAALDAAKKRNAGKDGMTEGDVQK